jgi:hypothetical protein
MTQDQIRKARAAIAAVQADECHCFDALRDCCTLSTDASDAEEKRACWCWAKAEAALLALANDRTAQEPHACR